MIKSKIHCSFPIEDDDRILALRERAMAKGPDNEHIGVIISLNPEDLVNPEIRRLYGLMCDKSATPAVRALAITELMHRLVIQKYSEFIPSTPEAVASPRRQLDL